MIEGQLQGFAHVLEPLNMLNVFFGTALGLLVGALPGLSSPMAIIVLLPITYKMQPLPALLLMMGVYVGTKLGGSYSAILLRTPGTPAAACTALDGYPMAQRGQAGLALGYATMGSTVGGLFGWILAVTTIPFLSTIVVKSSNADIALIGILGLVMVSAFVRASMLRGLIGVSLGLLIATVGLDPIDASERFTFGNIYLLSGIPFTSALIGFFGFTVVLSDIALIGRHSNLVSSKVNLALPKFKDLVERWQCILIGGLWGTGVGAIPGVGAESATWLAYATIRNRSKTPEKFGTGIPEGVLTPEATNNAVTGGTMVPMLTLGIPGDGSTAIMLGAMILHGIEPGVTLMQTNAELVHSILAGLLLATAFMFVISWKAIRYFILILQRDRSWLFPFILVFATIGAFSSMNTLFPVIVAISSGVFGYILESRKFPVVTIVLGIILSPIIEENARLALALSDNHWSPFVATWPRRIMVATIVILVAYEIYKAIKDKYLTQPYVDSPIVSEHAHGGSEMKRLGRKMGFLLILASGVGLALTSGPVTAAEYPSKPIHLVVPFKAGGGTDTIGRGIAEALEKAAGVPVVVDNITGAGGVVGSFRVVKAKPDGYTVLMTGTTDMTAAMAFKKLPFTLDDFIYIGGLYSSPTWILAHKDRGYKTMEELIAKAKANPRKITLGTAGPAGAQMIMASAIIGITGAKFRIIPYSGGKDLKKALYGNQVDAGILHAPVMLSAVKTGLMRVIGTGMPLDKITYKPVRKVKTLTDIGIPIKIGITRGMFVPKKTPKKIVAKLSRIAEKAAKSEVFRKFGNRFGFAPDWSDGRSFEKQIRAELRLYKRIKAKYIDKKK